MTSQSNPEEVLSPSGDRYLTVRGAARSLGIGEARVRKMIDEGQFESTRDPTLLVRRKGRGRKPEVLVTAESVMAISAGIRDSDLHSASNETESASIQLKLAAALQRENELRAEVEKLRDIVRLSLLEAEKRDEATALLRQQIMQFVIPDFPDDIRS